MENGRAAVLWYIPAARNGKGNGRTTKSGMEMEQL